MFGWAPWGHTGAPLSLSLFSHRRNGPGKHGAISWVLFEAIIWKFRNPHLLLWLGLPWEESTKLSEAGFLEEHFFFFFFLLWVEDSDVMFEWSAALKRTFTSRVKTLTSLLLHYIMNMQTYLSMSLWSVNYQIRVDQRWTGEVRGRGGRDIDFFFFFAQDVHSWCSVPEPTEPPWRPLTGSMSFVA